MITSAPTDLPTNSTLKRKDPTHEDDDLEPLESLTSSTCSLPASCKRRHFPAQGGTYQDAATSEMRALFGSEVDDAFIDSVYEQCDEDMYKSIARLVAATGLHPHLVQETRPQEEAKEESPAHRSSQGAFRFAEVKGDLFSCPPSHSLAHCISTDIAMGKGIATAFKARFGGVPELKQQQKKVGQVAILRRDERYVYYLITKARYWNKPTYEDLQSSLEDMKAHAVSHDVRCISMPRIGCGLDGLLWPQVRQVLQRVFADTDLTLTVYSRE